MGEFGIQILGDGDVDVAKNGLGVDGEQAVETCLETLGTLGFRQLRAAILAPGAAHPDIVEQPHAAAAPVAQLPVDVAAGAEPGPFKCPECGLTYAGAGTCVGGEYGHPPATLQPAEQVHTAADPDGTKAAAEAAAAPAAPASVIGKDAEPLPWGAAGQPDRRVGAVDRRQTQLPVPAGAKDRRIGKPDRRQAETAAAPAAPPSWPTQ
jgi:hypothetical protein